MGFNNGIKILWDKFTPAHGKGTPIVFPITFTKCFTVYFSFEGNNSQKYPPHLISDTVTNSGFTCFVNYAYIPLIYWIAIGY